jgi:hypothetical protein
MNVTCGLRGLLMKRAVHGVVVVKTDEWIRKHCIE